MKYSDELHASYSKKKRIIYGIALVLHIAAMAFFCIELAVYHPISPDYWTEIAKLGGKSCPLKLNEFKILPSTWGIVLRYSYSEGPIL